MAKWVLGFVAAFAAAAVQATSVEDIRKLFPRCAAANKGNFKFLGDKLCHGPQSKFSYFNRKECGWDGGDCCEQTCGKDKFVVNKNSKNDCAKQIFTCLNPMYKNKTISGCNVGLKLKLGNAVCDLNGNYNTKKCGWDGGDCCMSTCKDTSSQKCNPPPCGACKNPKASESSHEADLQDLGDGWCDVEHGLNTKNCGWDKGDCCEPTCKSAKFKCGVASLDNDEAWMCRDPSSFGEGSCRTKDKKSNTCNKAAESGKCFCDSGCSVIGDCCSDYAEVCTGAAKAKDTKLNGCNVKYPEWLGDSRCDSFGQYNTKECKWDGGDCCPSTCHGAITSGGGVFLCGDPKQKYDCKDPDAPACPPALVNLTGNGVCDVEANIPKCDYDQGDCCEESCKARQADKKKCGPYSCLDRFFKKNETGTCEVGFPHMVGNKKCDGLGNYNTKKCGWDGGDCCPSTNKAKARDSDPPFNWVCRDDRVSDKYRECVLATTTTPSSKGDGKCDGNTELNTKVCDWDGGDCCPKTCKSNTTCGSMLCRDPAQVDRPCKVDFPDWLHDSFCDTGAFNTKRCNWDGGDCCKDTCTKVGSGTSLCIGPKWKHCRDPDACPADGSKVGDGICNDEGAFNTAKCKWDGGDCCSQTCDKNKFPKLCGAKGYTCRDPNHHDNKTKVCEVPDTDRLGDGHCDAKGNYNTALCKYDGGDCCQASCKSTHKHLCSKSSVVCKDPKYAAKEKSKCGTTDLKLKSDKRCDAHSTANSKVCGWDGGDCCKPVCRGASCIYCQDPVVLGKGTRCPKTCHGKGTYSDGRAADCYCDASCSQHSLKDCCDDYAATCALKGCKADFASWAGDAMCDSGELNTRACGWDGGDCCPSTCKAGNNMVGCLFDFDCQDPKAVKCSDSSKQGDGKCDVTGDLNTVACGYDGGDCCETTCISTKDHECGERGYTCLDPKGKTTSVACKVGISDFVGDGFCDSLIGYNKRKCNWDNGDCCKSTCNGTHAQACRDFSKYKCLDPQAEDFWQKCPPALQGLKGNGHCDAQANIIGCEWDGGDCCKKTCKSKRCSIKDDTQCKDPRYYHPYSCLNRCNEAKGRAYSLKKCFCDPKCLQFGDCCNDFLTQCVPKACKVKFKEWLGDGKCESSGNGHGEYNTAECFWDGGDCCKDTCNSTGTEYACGSAAIGYECKQPGQCAVKEIQRVGNGLCDNDFNTKTCSWDGGDCCEKSCKGKDCGKNGFTCLSGIDPLNACEVSSTKFLGDDFCDNEGNYNTAKCNWDKGDCCMDTCGQTHPNTVRDYCDLHKSSQVCRNKKSANYNATSCPVSRTVFVGDGACDTTEKYNTKGCNWDGGDCCDSTCKDSKFFKCGFVGYSCLDAAAMPPPSAGSCKGKCGKLFGSNTTCSCDKLCLQEGTCCSDYKQQCGKKAPPKCQVWIPDYLGDARCNDNGQYNTEACNWDAGDCCKSTCRTAKVSGVHGVAPFTRSCDDPQKLAKYQFMCRNPKAPEYINKNPNQRLCRVPKRHKLGDGMCDRTSDAAGYNTKVCGWDGGDCCTMSCSRGGHMFSCHHSRMQCLDPQFLIPTDKPPLKTPLTTPRPIVAANNKANTAPPQTDQGGAAITVAVVLGILILVGGVAAVGLMLFLRSKKKREFTNLEQVPTTIISDGDHSNDHVPLGRRVDSSTPMFGEAREQNQEEVVL